MNLFFLPAAWRVAFIYHTAFFANVRCFEPSLLLEDCSIMHFKAAIAGAALLTSSASGSVIGIDFGSEWMKVSSSTLQVYLRIVRGRSSTGG